MKVKRSFYFIRRKIRTNQCFPFPTVSKAYVTSFNLNNIGTT